VVVVLVRFTKGMFDFPSSNLPWQAIIPRRILISDRVDKRTGQAVAIKVIDVENAEDEVEDIIQEISILSELHSPFVTQYYGSYLRGSDLWIVMEFCSGGSCGDLMKPGLIQEEYISIIIRELLLGLDYLHGDKKLHRDIKGMQASPSDLLGLQGLTSENSCKCSFGRQWSS
jgi:serine/threonine protein kinase